MEASLFAASVSPNNVDSAEQKIVRAGDKETRTSSPSTANQGPRRTSFPISTCVCYPTLYGSIDLDKVGKWIKYYMDLGIDEFFMWHWGDISFSQAFQEFNRTPNVTISPMPDEFILRKPPKRAIEGGQREAEKRCLKLARARNITWALLVDADEFLWFRQYIGLKEFLMNYERYTYISFGKWMYSTKYTIEGGKDMGDYGVGPFPFTPYDYCYRRPGNKECPTWVGRAKVMVRPQLYDSVGVHGDPAGKKGSVHINTDIAHLKEWVGIANRKKNVTVRSPQDFETMEKLDVHAFYDAHPKNSNGSITVYFDPDLESWLNHVNSLAGR